SRLANGQYRQPGEIDVWRLAFRGHRSEVLPHNYRGFYNGFRLNRRGARAAEWAGLENRCGACATAGSNPALSAPLRPPFANRKISWTCEGRPDWHSGL